MNGTAIAEKRAAEVQRIIAILHTWGIHTLGQLAALKQEEVVLRLGPVAGQMWTRANGQATRLLKLVPPAESFSEFFEFENEIETTEPLLFILRRFLEQFSFRLGALYLVAQELQLRITFSDKNSYEHLFKIPEPSNQVEVLFRMLQTHLETFTSEAPIVAVALEATATKPSQQQFGFFESALRDPTQLSETLARLEGLLGSERVGTPVLEETHRPDAFRMQAFSWELPPPAGLTNRSSGSTALRRFRQPTAATLFFEENEPRHFRSGAAQGKVQEHAGPYLASGNWWDEKNWSRAEWDLQLEEDVLCRCHSEKGSWQVDGVYD